MRSSRFLSSLLLTLLCAFSAHSQTPVAEIREQLGGPTLFIDGRPHSAFSTMTYRPQLSDYQELADIGIDLFCFSTSSDHPFYPFAADAWIGPEEYDYSQLDERARQVLEASPEAWLLPRVNVAAPGWWLDLHPEEVCVYSDGSNLELSRDYVQDQRAPSMASRLWRDSVKENLARMIDHIEAQDYGKRVIGYHIASGITEEWMYWGFQSNQLADYSKPGIAAFRNWLREKYRTDTVLQDVWGEPSATFATAEVPNATWRNRMDHGTFLNPIQSMRVVDYNLFLSDMVADCISEFARAVKEKTNGTKVVGAFYGYLLEIAWHHHAIPPSGHLAIDKLLRDPSLDFFSSPSSYGARPPGTGFSIFMSLTESFRRHGKLWMDENDYRGFLAKDAKPQHGYVETLDETLALHWRELGDVLTHGAGMWWFNMWGGWYSDPRLLEQMETMVELGKENLELDKDSTAEVAVVVDPLSPAYLGAMETLHSIGLLQYKETWAKFGAPFDLL
ncbi:MAG: beta-galactosidase, partial [Candidatus Omnitrophica bacterium]|nr:beta-galactosidase [Candidatus Omnitrophota bacterium]